LVRQHEMVLRIRNDSRDNDKSCGIGRRGREPKRSDSTSAEENHACRDLRQITCMHCSPRPASTKFMHVTTRQADRGVLACRHVQLLREATNQTSCGAQTALLGCSVLTWFSQPNLASASRYRNTRKEPSGSATRRKRKLT
jgi:hypothetical protein